MKNPVFLLLMLSTILFIMNACAEAGKPALNSSDSESASSATLLKPNYEAAVSEVSPSLKLKLKLKSLLVQQGITSNGNTVLDSIRSDSNLYKVWVGWDNQNGGILSPSAPDGWMPYIEDDSTAQYIDNNTENESNNQTGVPDGEPDFKSYSILNKVFFGNGSDTIYGSARFLDMIILNLSSQLTGVQNSVKIKLPDWFGSVYKDDTTTTNILQMNNTITYSNLSPNNPLIMIGYLVDKTTGGQELILYSQMVKSGMPSVSLFYGRMNDLKQLYIKSIFVNFASDSNWIYSHIAEIRTSGQDFIVRKANKIWGDGSAGAPLGTVYTHALTGGGSIQSNSFCVLRWSEVKYSNALYTSNSQPTLESIRTNDSANESYFFIRFDANATYNARFIPLFGSNNNFQTHFPADLNDDPNTVSYFTQKPECRTYTMDSRFYDQSEIPGWQYDTPALFPEWTVVP